MTTTTNTSENAALLSRFSNYAVRLDLSKYAENLDPYIEYQTQTIKKEGGSDQGRIDRLQYIETRKIELDSVIEDFKGFLEMWKTSSDEDAKNSVIKAFKRSQELASDLSKVHASGKVHNAGESILDAWRQAYYECRISDSYESNDWLLGRFD